MMLEEDLNSLEMELSDVQSSVGTWRTISIVALVIGLAIGYLVMRYHNN